MRDRKRYHVGENEVGWLSEVRFNNQRLATIEGMDCRGCEMMAAFIVELLNRAFQDPPGFDGYQDPPSVL